jgi:hypothetical protein
MATEPTGAAAPKHAPIGHDAFDPLRHVRLESGHTLRTWDTGRSRNGRTCIAYELCEPSGTVLFHGDDFRPSPLHADDGDATLRALLGFLFLRPGDTDREYFEGYSRDQLRFATSDCCELLAFLYSEEVVGTENAGTFEDVEGEGEDETPLCLCDDCQRSYGPRGGRHV